jgi:hypothetical protein
MKNWQKFKTAEALKEAYFQTCINYNPKTSKGPNPLIWPETGGTKSVLDFGYMEAEKPKKK